MGLFDFFRRERIQDQFALHMQIEIASTNIWNNIDKISQKMLDLPPFKISATMLPQETCNKLQSFTLQRVYMAACFIFHHKMLVINPQYMSHPLYMSVQIRLAKRLEALISQGEVNEQEKLSGEMIKDAALRAAAEVQFMITESIRTGLSFKPLAKYYLAVSNVRLGDDPDTDEMENESMFKKFAVDVDHIWNEKTKKFQSDN